MKKDPRVTVFFHTFENRRIHHQGQILKCLPDGRILVQLFSWVNGYPTDEKIVEEIETVGWRFYFSEKSWNVAAKLYLAELARDAGE